MKCKFSPLFIFVIIFNNNLYGQVDDIHPELRALLSTFSTCESLKSIQSPINGGSCSQSNLGSNFIQDLSQFEGISCRIAHCSDFPPLTDSKKRSDLETKFKEITAKGIAEELINKNLKLMLQEPIIEGSLTHSSNIIQLNCLDHISDKIQNDLSFQIEDIKKAFCPGLETDQNISKKDCVIKPVQSFAKAEMDAHQSLKFENLDKECISPENRIFFQSLPSLDLIRRSSNINLEKSLAQSLESKRDPNFSSDLSDSNLDENLKALFSINPVLGQAFRSIESAPAVGDQRKALIAKFSNDIKTFLLAAQDFRVGKGNFQDRKANVHAALQVIASDSMENRGDYKKAYCDNMLKRFDKSFNKCDFDLSELLKSFPKGNCFKDNQPNKDSDECRDEISYMCEVFKNKSLEVDEVLTQSNRNESSQLKSSQENLDFQKQQEAKACQGFQKHFLSSKEWKECKKAGTNEQDCLNNIEENQLKELRKSFFESKGQNDKDSDMQKMIADAESFDDDFTSNSIFDNIINNNGNSSHYKDVDIFDEKSSDEVDKRIAESIENENKKIKKQSRKVSNEPSSTSNEDLPTSSPSTNSQSFSQNPPASAPVWPPAYVPTPKEVEKKMDEVISNSSTTTEEKNKEVTKIQEELKQKEETLSSDIKENNKKIENLLPISASDSDKKKELEIENLKQKIADQEKQLKDLKESMNQTNEVKNIFDSRPTYRIGHSSIGQQYDPNKNFSSSSTQAPQVPFAPDTSSGSSRVGETLNPEETKNNQALLERYYSLKKSETNEGQVSNDQRLLDGIIIVESEGREPTKIESLLKEKSNGKENGVMEIKDPSNLKKSLFVEFSGCPNNCQYKIISSVEARRRSKHYAKLRDTLNKNLRQNRAPASVK